MTGVERLRVSLFPPPSRKRNIGPDWPEIGFEKIPTSIIVPASMTQSRI